MQCKLRPGACKKPCKDLTHSPGTSIRHSIQCDSTGTLSVPQFQLAMPCPSPALGLPLWACCQCPRAPSSPPPHVTYSSFAKMSFTKSYFTKMKCSGDSLQSKQTCSEKSGSHFGLKVVTLATIFMTDHYFYDSKEQHPHLWFSNLVAMVLGVCSPHIPTVVTQENPGR